MKGLPGGTDTEVDEAAGGLGREGEGKEGEGRKAGGRGGRALAYSRMPNAEL